jgi:hypothetical protein
MMDKHGANVDVIRAVDHDIATRRLAGHDRARLGQRRVAHPPS